MSELKLFQKITGFEDDLVGKLPRSTHFGFVPVKPNAPCNYECELKQVEADMLDKDEMPDEVHKLPIQLTISVKWDTGQLPGFFHFVTVPKQMTPPSHKLHKWLHQQHVVDKDLPWQGRCFNMPAK